MRIKKIAASMRLPISEVFSSIQGEGKTMGKPSVFLRLGGCNLMCGGQGTQFDNELHNGAKWRCDSIEVWMKAIAKPLNEIFTPQMIRNLTNGFHLIITGGEPLMQQENILALLEYLKEEENLTPFVEIESNGTIMPNERLFKRVNQFNVSPKLSNSGNERSARLNESVLKKLSSHENTQFKYVIAEKEDWSEVLQDFIPIHGSRQVCLMPAGETQDQLNKTREMVSQICIAEAISYTDRLHIVLWNKKTGV